MPAFAAKKILRFFLSPTGRIKRLPFLFGLIPLSVLLYIIMNIGNTIAQAENLFVLVGIFAFVFSTIWSYWILHIKRLHDVNLSGWLSLINLMPIINFLLLLFLLFKGSVEPNKYGEAVSAEDQNSYTTRV